MSRKRTTEVLNVCRRESERELPSAVNSYEYIWLLIYFYTLDPIYIHAYRHCQHETSHWQLALFTKCWFPRRPVLVWQGKFMTNPSAFHPNSKCSGNYCKKSQWSLNINTTMNLTLAIEVVLQSACVLCHSRMPPNWIIVFCAKKC